jgi:hypothetical protein
MIQLSMTSKIYSISLIVMKTNFQLYVYVF